MATIRLRYVHEFVDSSGRVRRYFRRQGKRTALPGLPGSPEFMRAYEEALNGKVAKASRKAPTPYSLDDLALRYYASAAFKMLAPSTQAAYRGPLEILRRKHGPKLMRDLDRATVKNLIDERADEPAAANFVRRILKIMCALSVEIGWIKHDPTAGVKKLAYKTEGARTWIEDDIARFEKAHAIGTTPRLALALLLYTGQRRSDVVRMTRGHVKGGWISVQQQKTGTALDVPLHSELARVLEGTPSEHLTLLTTQYGKAFTVDGFGGRFKDWCRKAGVPDLSAHGLRKACATRLADAGCSVHEIAAVTGHKKLADLEVYTRAADQKRLAKAAIGKIKGRRS
jgi:integrase